MKLKYIKFEYKSMGKASTNKLNININQAHLKVNLNVSLISTKLNPINLNINQS